MPVSPPRETPQRETVQRPKRMLKGDSDRFAYDESRRPAQTDYNWKRASTFGQADEEHLIRMEMQGWTPVPAERHPELFLKGKAPAGGSIQRGGQILYERPMELSDEARAEDAARARQQVNDKLDEIGHAPQGHFPRQGAKVVRDVERIEIADD